MALSVDQMRDAYRAGVRRSRAARERGGTHRWGWAPQPEEQRRVDGYSAVAEAIVADALGRKWTSDGTVPDLPDDGDIEGGISVRWTDRDNGSLILHPDEPDRLNAVLVVGVPPSMRIAGWINVAAGKNNRFWRENVRHPAFFVPQNELSEIETITKGDTCRPPRS